MKVLSREEFKALLDSGRLMVWATLQDRQDFFVQINKGYRLPVRDVTNEPNHHTRRFIGK